MGMTFEQLMSLDWAELVKLGVDKSVKNGITLSIFKDLTKTVFPRYDFENEGWDEEDFWTHRFENWCTEIMRWSDACPINKATCFEWAQDYVRALDDE